MRYRVDISPAAAKTLEALSSKVRESIIRHLRGLAENPRPPGVKILKGHRDLFRLRVGVYRVIYTVQDNHLWVLVVKIGHRSSIYRRL